MSEKRRGLGRGLGALIPAGLDGQRPPAGGDRPVDVFFPDRSDATSTSGEATAAESNGVANAQVAAAAAASTAVAESTGSATNGTTTGVPAAASNGGVALADGAAVVTAGVADPADFSAIATDGLVPVPGARFAELPVGSIRPNPRQPRSVFDEDALDELVNSIREIGVLQPVVVRAVDDGYELIMGERRWRATQAAGLDVIPAIVRETDDADLLRDALLENLHRSQLNPLEEAAAYQQLLDDFGCTHEELATRIHRSRPQISNTLRLLKLPPLVQRRVAAGVLSAGHARALLGLADGAAIERLAQRIVAEGLSVRAVEEIVSLGGDDAAPGKRRQAPRAGQRNEALDELSSRLSDRFDTRVKVQLGKSRGRLTVEFASVQDLNRILATFAPDDPGLLKG
ncbi:MAG: ParB/RepB/Spo0J family partition protein [Cellulomonas sp.]|uniref:ParB/RepB/Spo0J family partition protein n=1 Tax=Cellulomonas sp. A375-1 TaxID=1672219 RepID=UPI000652775E|nr:MULTISPECIES: ParB/RepB/Spo0J family partition protein [unclassified Cellulomonas]KMM44259.1 chromosome partitioning protein ParB [Cellulomonas sp. A375-1]MCR6649128.1 ParB/RepB/Spo0J family partition protein [Cellulomonas sp.]